MSDAGISVIFYKIVLISQKNAVDFYSFMNSFITKLFISNRFRTCFFWSFLGCYTMRMEIANLTDQFYALP